MTKILCLSGNRLVTLGEKDKTKILSGNTGTLKKKGGGTLPRTGSKDSKDSSTLLKTLDEERGEV